MSNPRTPDQGYDYSVLLRRNEHGDVVEDKTRGNGTRRFRAGHDKRLFDAMTTDQENAFLMIGYAWTLRTVGMGAKISRYGEYTPATGHGDPDHGADTLRRYDMWHVRCKRLSLSPLMALDVIADGLTMAASDELRRVRNGTCKKNLLACLDAWRDV